MLARGEQKGWIEGVCRTTEKNRETKYYAITKSGTRALAERVGWQERSAGLVNRLLAGEAEWIGACVR